MIAKDESFKSAHQTPDAGAALAYGDSLRNEMKAQSSILGGHGDAVVTVLCRQSHKTFVRILFTRKSGLVRYAPEDEEWHVCANWLSHYAAHSGCKITSGRLLLKGDLCIIVRDLLDPSFARDDAAAVLNSLIRWHENNDTVEV